MCLSHQKFDHTGGELAIDPTCNQSPDHSVPIRIFQSERPDHSVPIRAFQSVRPDQIGVRHLSPGLSSLVWHPFFVRFLTPLPLSAVVNSIMIQTQMSDVQ